RVFPVRDHYYEPLVNPAHLTRSLEEPRALPGIEWDDSAMLAQLDAFDFNDELLAIPREGRDGFFYNNPGYGRGDAEMLYNFLRHLKPRRFIEIGCGMSTRLAQLAFVQNEKDGAPSCEHTCIEPYENPWLEQLDVTVLRQRVEDVIPDVFAGLAPRDVVFIDSSHVIRPQGDVVTEYLQILPRLPKGVWAHIHDIATPMDYPTPLIVEQVKLWNEQYLLEAFLTHNRDWKIRWMMNHLLHTHPEAVQKKCPITAEAMQNGELPRGACFWMEKVS
ncbi:MAG: class I SAM-dependent methyltransferase, partial [Verrucomicrobiales bacterium]|nr:class I SAM-dependent methyltransferase [Verrucomicrobiales bacterium]